jgi:hypothetical protein
MAGGIASSTVPTGANSTTPRKGHNRRESTGHVCTACDQVCYNESYCGGHRLNPLLVLPLQGSVLGRETRMRTVP